MDCALFHINHLSRKYPPDLLIGRQSGGGIFSVKILLPKYVEVCVKLKKQTSMVAVVVFWKMVNRWNINEVPLLLFVFFLCFWESLLFVTFPRSWEYRAVLSPPVIMVCKRMFIAGLKPALSYRQTDSKLLRAWVWSSVIYMEFAPLWTPFLQCCRGRKRILMWAHLGFLLQDTVSPN